ncbi:head GIN domain-containing protein [Flavobacterium sp. FZUC8N2.13]|uniref:Head GIN domain-containing protein n=1 Tax=Flavobacterium zubiriense TaxID=3138075 RepID=A0ABV4TCK5_9FLAO
MQKTKFNTFILFSLIILLFASCINYERTETVKTVKSSGNITQESRYFDEDFNKINVSCGINVVIEQSTNTEVTVITDEDFQQKIKTKVENGTLYISNTTSKTTFSIFGYKRTKIHDAATKKVIIKLPIIKELEANSASKIENKGILRGNSIALKSSSASEIKLNLEYEKIDAESSSASKIDLEGLAIDFNAYASSASKIEADDLLVNTATAESSSASKISIHPSVSLKANANSAGEIKYKKIPKQIEKTINSGGNIKQD